ncbi:GlcG/HbpS family heme-binding protein [Pseudomarimonas arenosa]|uniref:Heme-binding protein n=1 Tax=Pseudomarimonas arenosa TaxID=2774145 RepID=A0AAW3ZFB6_9GAMM|nr:heme-binding protein [Pseudomarimonas arenosa]MBD8524329.1 heme-binding protein [Pseudomarimonas arenosa]
MHKLAWTALSLALTLALSACSGGSNSTDPVGTAPPPPEPPRGCEGACVSAQSFLSTAEVRTIIAQAVAEAGARNAKATIAVVDRVGNVLAVYRMNGAETLVRVGTQRGVVGGLEGLNVPRELAAIAKAITGAYLSSEGNAFSTRTANQIVQEHFNPGEFNAPSGPLFGVQFSQLSCSDFTTRDFAATGPGPHRSPLGLSADPGGLPLYKSGVPVGGIGVAADNDYGLDPVISDRDQDLDELIATAGTFGFAAPVDRRGDRITVDGKTFRFNDAEFSDLSAGPGNAASLESTGFQTVPAYWDGVLRDGTVFGSPASGFRPDADHYPGRDAFVLVDRDGALRYPPIDGTDGAGAITAEEARVLVDEALAIANAARAQIRQPLGTQARVSISVVDTNGTILAFARTRDAPIFGADVSLQKARTAAFYSGAFAAEELLSRPEVNYFATSLVPNANATALNLSVVDTVQIGDYVSRVREFLDSPTALGDGAFAFSDRAGGNLSRPYFPDGIISPQSGPFSRPFDQWSPFHDGIQLDLVYNNLALHVAHYVNQLGLPILLEGELLVGAPRPGFPAPLADPAPGSCTGTPRLANGIQIFPGSVPIYRNGQLVGGIGVSGDGIDQDDMISFLGTHNAGLRLNSGIGNAPPEIRADQLEVRGSRLRYVQCPQSPFLNSDQQNVCGGK